MELTVAKKDLLKLVTRMQGVAERKSTMPVLSNVLLADRRAERAARRRDRPVPGARRPGDRRGQQGRQRRRAGEGPARARADDARRADSPRVAGQRDARRIKAAGAARRYTLRGMPGDDFPPLPSPAEGSPSLALDVDVLRELIDKTHFSISADETRAHLNCALFEWDGDIVRMVTTDGHRLSKMEVKVTRPAGVGDDAHPAQGDPGAAAPLRRDLAQRGARTAAPKPAAPDHPERVERVLPGAAG